MAERSEEYLKRIADILCREFNKLNSGHYNFKRISNKNEPEFDFIIGNSNLNMGVQLKTLENTSGYYRERKKIQQIISKLRQRIKIANLTNIFLSLKFKQIPKNNDEINELLKNIMVFLIEHFRFHQSKYLPRFTPQDVVLLNGMFKYLSELWFDWISQDEPYITFGHENWSFGGPIDLMVDEILTSIQFKDSHYGKITGILLFESDPIPIGEIEIDELRKRCKDYNFNFSEVWVINLANEGFCDKIYPWP
ncbi:MAG: hypothetical protein GX409_05515 [candidate division Zixibacteria bacterium]|nr:hypothetical protein [candidate division Zixibacteria bacterium]